MRLEHVASGGDDSRQSPGSAPLVAAQHSLTSITEQPASETAAIELASKEAEVERLQGVVATLREQAAMAHAAKSQAAATQVAVEKGAKRAANRAAKQVVKEAKKAAEETSKEAAKKAAEKRVKAAVG